MANTTNRAQATFTNSFIEELLDTVPQAKKGGKHVGFREIRFKAGRVEFDYTVTTGKIVNEGTMIVRFAGDDELGKLSNSLAKEFGKLYAEIERTR